MVAVLSRRPGEVASAPAPGDEGIAWHSRPVGEIAAELGVDPGHGLGAEEASSRARVSGPNELEPVRRPTLLTTTLRALRQPFIVLLAAAGLLALAFGEVRDGLLILIGLVPIIGADVITEYRAERALEALREAAAPLSEVRRDGMAQQVAARDLVPGDVVLLRTGDVVPADLRITRSDALTVDRSVLTGESLPEEASAAPDPPEAGLADRRSMAYAGTAVVLGRGEGLVVAIGGGSELGRIAARLGTSRPRSPLQRELDRLVRILLVLAAGLIAYTVGAALVRGEALGSAVIAGITAAIAAIPEEPPVLLAVVLGLGAYRLLRRGVLVRRLTAQETLGAIDLIITDKTGTLTENRLTLEDVLDADGQPMGAPARAAAVREALRAETDTWDSEPGIRRGTFTRALLAAAPAAPALDPADLLAATPPSHDQPYAFTRSRRDGAVEERALGAPEAILERLAVDDPQATAWRHSAATVARAGRRLLLLAGREAGGTWRAEALFAFGDVLRDAVPPALAEAAAAGIQTLIVTGDHPETAAVIADAAGVPGAHVVTGAELDRMDDATLTAALTSLRVVARATPDHKLRLVRLARAAGRTVAVTGDGVNDAPALQNADVAVAMGSGTQVAREAADLVLGDDSFATLIAGLAEGRRIVANVEKGLVFLTSTHVAMLGFVLIATLAGFSHPLLPIQILWLELFIDLAASVAFEREAAEPGLMRRPPRSREHHLLTAGLLARIGFAGGATAIAALALMLTAGGGPEHARWLAFNALVFGQLVRAWANRSLTLPVRLLQPNGFLALACVVAAVVQLAIPYLPPVADAFQASPLNAFELLLVGLVGLVPAVVAELYRTIRRETWVA